MYVHARGRFLRHPSYFGWYWWSVGTQLLLCNPVCAVLYAAAVSQFFRNRIPYEEAMLIDFFGRSYIEYMRKSRIGIPFVKSADQWLKEVEQH